MPDLIVLLVGKGYLVDPLELGKEVRLEIEERGGPEEPYGIVRGVELDNMGG